MKRYAITDSPEIANIQADMIQIRAKHLSPRDLTTLVRAALAHKHASKLLVNTHIDIALACGADGVHLPSHSIAPSHIRAITPPDFLIGVSCHTLDDLRAAESEGADFAVYGPIFATGNKRPLGLPALRAATAAIRLPIYALGGVTEQNAQLCIEAGAIGVAGISLFRWLLDKICL
jgi:thiamine-phosphate pyrophosphorylase